jgi:hypothetical protein
MKLTKQFISYAHQDLSRKKIIQYATQYDGVDMAELLGADEDRFPFVVDDGTVVFVCFWNPYSGIVMELDADPVRAYAAQQFLRENVYPVFESLEAAEKYSIEREWPRKEQPAEQNGTPDARPPSDRQ